jgi:hypothetical protein
VDVAQLHRRLTGSKSKACARTKPLRANDDQMDANTESTRITNATNKEKLGYMTHDQASMSITGRAAAAPAQPGVIEPLPQPAPGTGPGPGETNGKLGGGPNKVQGTRSEKPGPKDQQGAGSRAGTTKEDRQVKKGAQVASAPVWWRHLKASYAFGVAPWNLSEEQVEAWAAQDVVEEDDDGRGD